jgi:hypothetical protein
VKNPKEVFMKVSSEIDSHFESKIQIASVKEGGNSTWAEKEGTQESSIRLTFYQESGRFDRSSSSELPLWGLKELMQAAAAHDMLSKADLAEIIGCLVASVFRQS